ncbi:hypothetical protein MTZ49_10610 [Entomomonas sp. E2T0]|uniref:hypothetical protein n=1 Tax=Entomomonas sp. E2T0 TaxID=2930213 RepID=UPI00222850F4|nr:hypothetical protein [Entomomonas sp. E2T0]UYZ83053.1 hypothetical protein MTZ49_10610 [Entomomonas sp. E2T0]
MDEAGNTPEEQFNLILEPVSTYEYVMQQIKNGAEIRVSNKEYGKGIITQVYTECPDSILVDILFEDERELCDVSLGEVLGQYWKIL